VSRGRAALGVGLVVLAAGLGLGAWLGSGGSGGATELPTTVTGPPPLARLRIIFPEGFTVREMGHRVAAVRVIAIRRRNVVPRLTRSAYLLAAARAKPPVEFRKDWAGRRPEGFLFPALYEFSQYTSGRDLVADQLAAFRKRWAKVDLRYARSKNLTPYDVLIIASMVEEETVAPEERRLVAAVIYNRLKRRMPLGIDATIRYGLGRPGTQSLRKSDLASDNPYNTRRRLGLPPTPITNPGLASMKAAANPARVDYLYFVRKPDKVHHFFTADENEFLRKACEYGFGCR
jgi:peptidoglycan lytic transglycosylase G